MDIRAIEEKYILTADYHTHSVYSRVGPYIHGKGTIMENVKAAAEKGLEEIAITDHGPSDFYGLDTRLIPRMREDIAEAAKVYPDIKIYLGVEADITDSENGLDVAASEFALYDFVNAGYHYVPNCNMTGNFIAFHRPCRASIMEELRWDNTQRILKALRSNDIKILTHPGDKAYIDEEEVAKACAETNTLVEINSRHKHPNLEDLKVYAAHDLKFVISSDAHRPEQVGRYAESLALATKAGIEIERIINVRER